MTLPGLAPLTRVEPGIYINATSASYGAVGDGVVDDTLAVQSAVSAAISLGETVFFPPGEYRLTGTVPIFSVRGLAFLGSGGLTKFNWDGNATDPMFTVGDVATSAFSGFTINASTSVPLAEAFRIENNGGSSVSPMFNHFKDIYIQGTNGGITYGFRGRIGAGGDANNDFMLFENVSVANYAHSAWSIEGTQFHGWKMSNCYAINGQYAVSGGGTDGAISNFNWDGGFVGNNTVADFFIATPSTSNLATQISNLSSEGSNRYLLTTGPSSALSRVTSINVRWASDGLNADGYAVYAQTPGPFIFINCGFGDAGAESVKVFWNPEASSVAPYMAFIGSTIIGTETTLLGAFPNSNLYKPYFSGSSLQTASATYRLDTLDQPAGNGAIGGFQTLSELTTIAAAATTDTTIQIPANAIVMSVSVYVKVTIPTATNFTVIGASSATAFNTAAVSVVATSLDAGTKSCPFYNAAAQAIRITPDLTPGTDVGRVRVVITYFVSTPAFQ